MEWSDGTTTAKYAYIQNLQGDIVGIVDSSGTEVVKYTYDAWGKVLSTTGSLAATLGTIQPFRYRGYVYDVETGLYYLRSRYYNPGWNRFVNADSIVMENLFAYCYDSPTMGRDNNGTDYEDLEAYCYNHFLGRARWEAIDHYRYAIIAKNTISRNGECIRVRQTPCCDSAYGFEIIQSSQISNIYVEDIFITEGDDVPDTAVDRDPDRIWFRALIFFNEPHREPVERYIYSEYLYIIFSFGSYYLGSLTNEEPVRVRNDPSRNNGWLFEVEKGTSVTILKTTTDNTWWFVNTPYGNGWVQRDYIQIY